MTFIPLTTSNRLVPGVGRDSARIAIVGDYTNNFDYNELTPFKGPAGSILESCLHAAGLIRGEVYLTNTFKSKSSKSGRLANTDFFDENKKKFTALGMEHVERLHEELNGIGANVIIAAGNPALRALSGLSSVAKYRGYVCETSKLAAPRKMIPTFSPMAAMRTQTYRHMIVHDLLKAKEESKFPEIIRPSRQLIYNHRTVEEALEWLAYYKDVERLSFDIEVINYETSCISFSSSPDIACVIPIGDSDIKPNGWTEQEELQIIRAVQEVLGNPKSVKVAQNGIFDIHFLLTRDGIIVRGPLEDTMIGHSVMFPDLPKGLDFLGSLYCGAQEYWKDSVRFDNIKGDS